MNRKYIDGRQIDGRCIDRRIMNGRNMIQESMARGKVLGSGMRPVARCEAQEYDPSQGVRRTV